MYHTSGNGFASTRICKPRLSASTRKLTRTRKRAVTGLVIQVTILDSLYNIGNRKNERFYQTYEDLFSHISCFVNDVLPH
jgi:hypothetical protein